MIEYLEKETVLVKDLELELSAIKHSFKATNEELPNSYKPFAVFFTDPEKKAFVINSRSVVDANDYYTAISEMLFAYSSLQASTLLLAIDSKKIINSVETDMLEVYMACPDFCSIFVFPYDIDSNGILHWNDNAATSTSIDALDKAFNNASSLNATLEIIEALYVHVKMEDQHFDFPKLKSFYERNNFQFAVIDE